MPPKEYVHVSPVTSHKYGITPAIKKHSHMINPRQSSAEAINRQSEMMTCFCCLLATRTPIRSPTRQYASAKSVHSMALERSVYSLTAEDKDLP